MDETSHEYIVLTTSDGSLSKKFYAIATGYKEKYTRSQSVDSNIEGDYLVTNGGNKRSFSYTLRLSQDMEPDEKTNGFGTKKDLVAMWQLNNPQDTPSDVLILTDHYGNRHFVKFNQNLELTPLTSTIVGTDSFFYTPIELYEVINE